jgi:tellurite resistance protein TerC
MTIWLWLGFLLLVFFMLALDLGVFHKHAHQVRIREAIVWSIIWFIVALLFNVLVYVMYAQNWLGVNTTEGIALSGRDAAMQFLTGYIIERSLSFDNIFVFAMIFTFFGVPSRSQYRVLFWGILGALILRGAMIAAGTALIQRFDWIIYVFGGLLLVTAIRMLFMDDEEVHPDRNILVRLARRWYPVSSGFEGERFFTRVDGRRAITPLFLVLLVIESSDVLFAVDSVPAVFAVTRDPFIVFTSNVFAILGLRAIYFVLVGALDLFRYLKISLVVVLVFVALKMLAVKFVHISTIWSLVIITAVLTVGIAASLYANLRERRAADPPK